MSYSGSPSSNGYYGGGGISYSGGYGSGAYGGGYGGGYGGPDSGRPLETRRYPLTSSTLDAATGGARGYPPPWDAAKLSAEDLYAPGSGNGKGKQRVGTHDPFPVSTYSGHSVSREAAFGTGKRSPVAKSFWGANPYEGEPYDGPSEPRSRVGDDLPNERRRVRPGPQRDVRVTGGDYHPSTSAEFDDVRDEPRVRSSRHGEDRERVRRTYAERDAERQRERDAQRQRERDAERESRRDAERESGRDAERDARRERRRRHR